MRKNNLPFNFWTKFEIRLLVMCERARAREILKYGFAWLNGFTQLVNKQIVRMHKLRMYTKGITSVKTKIQFNRALML